VKHGVFISYRQADSFVAARLRDPLGISFAGRVFIDVAGSAPGSDFVRQRDSVLEPRPVLVSVFKNECSGNVTFRVVRPTLPGIEGPLLWRVGLGQERAVAMLLPDQTVRLPMDGMCAGAALPWCCENQQALPDPI
jgi:hypothetical protein